MTKTTALTIYRSLPKKDCRRCGEDCCMDFAMKLSVGEVKLSECPKLTDKQKKTLLALLSPRVAAIETGSDKHSATIGGEEVLYRHEYRFVNKTAIFIDVSDLMGEDEVEKRIRFVKEFEVERIGEKLKVDGIALRCASDNPIKFIALAEKTRKAYSGPIIICSFNLKILETAASILKNRKPILYAATKETLKAVWAIAEKYGASFVLYSPDLEVPQKKFKNMLIDPGIESGIMLGDTINKLTILRKSAASGTKEAGYPIISSTVQEGIKITDFDESMLACILICRYASAVIMHTIEAWAMLPVLTLRQSLYSDPGIEPMVESKLYAVGQPDKNSPIILTSNFALTYYSVLGDLEKDKISCYLLPIDTSGLAVTVSVAADILTAGKIKDALERTKISEKVCHKKIIIPGFAARLADSIHEATNWEVIVGPQDSSQIKEFLEKNK